MDAVSNAFVKDMGNLLAARLGLSDVPGRKMSTGRSDVDGGTISCAEQGVQCSETNARKTARALCFLNLCIQQRCTICALRNCLHLPSMSEVVRACRENHQQEDESQDEPDFVGCTNRGHLPTPIRGLPKLLAINNILKPNQPRLTVSSDRLVSDQLATGKASGVKFLRFTEWATPGIAPTKNEGNRIAGDHHIRWHQEMRRPGFTTTTTRDTTCSSWI